MYIDKKVIFKYEQVYLDSVYVFEDGDFILFGVPDNILIEDQENKKIVPNSTKSAVFDKKTFKPKSILDISSLASFFNFANDEFAICKDSSSFEIYKFNNDRTSYTQIQTFPNSEGGSSKDIKQLANGDILMSRVYVGYKGIYVYRKNENNPKYAPYGEKFIYSFEDIDEFIDLNDKEVIGCKINHADDSLIIKIISTNDYKIIRKNEIKFNVDLQSRLYTSLPFYKIHKNKLIATGPKSLYIFGIDNLELETTINFDKFITKILIRPKENIFLLCESRDKKIFKEIGARDGPRFHYAQFIYNIKIDFETNDLIETKEENITKYCGENKELFSIYNYINNGIITLIDKSKIIFYEDCDD